jgi:hypothetical protein
MNIETKLKETLLALVDAITLNQGEYAITVDSVPIIESAKALLADLDTPYLLQGLYFGKWETLSHCETLKEAQQLECDYLLAERGTYRIIPPVIQESSPTSQGDGWIRVTDRPPREDEYPLLYTLPGIKGDFMIYPKLPGIKISADKRGFWKTVQIPTLWGN